MRSIDILSPSHVVLATLSLATVEYEPEFPRVSIPGISPLIGLQYVIEQSCSISVIRLTPCALRHPRPWMELSIAIDIICTVSCMDVQISMPMPRNSQCHLKAHSFLLRPLRPLHFGLRAGINVHLGVSIFTPTSRSHLLAPSHLRVSIFDLASCRYNLPNPCPSALIPIFLAHLILRAGIHPASS